MSDDVPVRKIDQENISAFSLLADEMKALKIELKDLEEDNVALNDVEDEVLLTEHLRGGEGMLYRYGDAFIELDDSRFEQVISADKARIVERIAKIKDRQAEVQDKMATLKAELYGRFRDQIALEMD
jgi:prefoldin subunit 4